MTREQWLQAIASKARTELFKREGYDAPEIEVSVGFPLGKRTGGNQETIGQCFPYQWAKDKLCHIFISPVVDTSEQAADILVHEMVHATVGNKEKHNKVFRKCAESVGLKGGKHNDSLDSMMATTAGPELTESIKLWIEEIGTYPHSKLDPKKRAKKQSTRMLKLMCPHKCTDLAVRTSKKWIDMGTLPLCPICECSMEES